VRYELAVDADTVSAIDTHVHIEVDVSGHTALPPALVEAAGAYFRAATTFPGLDEVADYYRERKLAAVVFTVNAGTTLGHTPVSSEEIA
jgi:hypothetical protein